VVDTFTVIGSPGFRRDEALLRELGFRAFDRGQNVRGFARHFAAIVASGDRTPRLRELTVPSLVIHGTHDPLIPVAAGRATARAIPGSRLLEINGMGHDLPRDLWPVFSDAIASVAAAGERTGR
jgi:pimeloyl-ACP methyl ester carboxylesterase